jgi:virulence factor Mce-like protein
VSPRAQQASLLASPVLVGATTVLVAVVAVFLSYNANTGLPFVPTYKLNAQVPDAAGLVKGNEVRVGGKRVGVIKQIDAVKAPDGTPVANLELALETRIQPLRSDSEITVRPRSPLGLKYLELKPGTSGADLDPNGTITIAQAQEIVELDQALNTFDEQTRRAAQETLNELGPALAGRGIAFNELLEEAPPFLRGIERVSANLADPRTDLAGFIRGADAAVGELAAAGSALGSFIEGANTTSGALAAAAPQLAEGIAETPPTELAAIDALRAARPALDDAAALVHDIRPATPLLKPAAEELDRAIDTGIPVVRRALSLADRLEGTLAAVASLSADPVTRGSLRRLSSVLDSARPTLEFVAPFQLQCNYLGLWTRNVPNTISEGDASGTWFRTLLVLQPDEFFGSVAEPAPNLHNNPQPHTAAPGQDGECEAGNEPFLPGQQIGNPPGNQGSTTELTGPPPGIPEGPR